MISGMDADSESGNSHGYCSAEWTTAAASGKSHWVCPTGWTTTAGVAARNGLAQRIGHRQRRVASTFNGDLSKWYFAMVTGMTCKVLFCTAPRPRRWLLQVVRCKSHRHDVHVSPLRRPSTVTSTSGTLQRSRTRALCVDGAPTFTGDRSKWYVAKATDMTYMC